MKQPTYKLHNSKQGFFLTMKEELTSEQAQITPHFQTLDGECYMILFYHSQIKINSLSTADQARLLGMFTLEEVAMMFQQIVRRIPEQDLRSWDAESFKTHFSGCAPRSWEVEVEMEKPDASGLLFGQGGAATVKITKIL